MEKQNPFQLLHVSNNKAPKELKHVILKEISSIICELKESDNLNDSL